MSDNINDILPVLADMEDCFPSDDILTNLVDAYDDGELSEEELSFVAAAGFTPNFDSFLKRFHLD